MTEVTEQLDRALEAMVAAGEATPGDEDLACIAVVVRPDGTAAMHCNVEIADVVRVLSVVVSDLVAGFYDRQPMTKTGLD